jgi:hypothetical protein
MPNQPDARDLHVDQLLTEVSIGYKNPLYIADGIFPVVPVRKQSNVVPKYNQSFWFRDAAQMRAPGTRSVGGGFTVDNTDTYFAPRFSFRFEIPDDIRDNSDQPYDLDNDGTEFVTDKILLKRELALATDFFTTSVWGADKVGGTDFTQWSDYGASAPLTDMAGFLDGVEALVGREPNVLVLGKQVWVQLKWHPDLIDTIKYTQTAMVDVDLAARLFALDKLLVGRAIQTTSPDGTAEGSVSYSRVWGKHGLLLFVPQRPGLFTPAAGYTFVWNRVPSALQYIKRMRDEERETDIIEGNTYFDQKALATKAGVFLQNAVA